MSGGLDDYMQYIISESKLKSIVKIYCQEELMLPRTTDVFREIKKRESLG
jgi:hypothetical protein